MSEITKPMKIAEITDEQGHYEAFIQTNPDLTMVMLTLRCTKPMNAVDFMGAVDTVFLEFQSSKQEMFYSGRKAIQSRKMH